MKTMRKLFRRCCPSRDALGHDDGPLPNSNRRRVVHLSRPTEKHSSTGSEESPSTGSGEDAELTTKKKQAPSDLRIIASDALVSKAEIRDEDTHYAACAVVLKAGGSVCLGETHVDYARERVMLTTHMKRLKDECGVEWIGLEVPRAFHIDDDEENMEFCYKLLTGKSPSLWEVRKAALEQGIKVIPYDYYQQDFEGLKQRLINNGVTGSEGESAEIFVHTHRCDAMNLYATDHLQPMMQSGKGLVLAGRAHFRGSPQSRYPLQKLLGCQAVDIDMN